MKKKSSLKNVISLNKINKVYELLHEKPTLVETIFFKEKRRFFTALNNFNFFVKKGEKIGIIGSNGAGKTTLLKIITGITTPTSGEINVIGRVVSLIDLTAGFHPDLTGKENIFLNAMLLGMKKNEVKRKLKKIIAFADIGMFIEEPLYTYSTGMKLRLGFAVAVHSNLDILILDEGITAGDEKFSAKASKKIKEFFSKGKTILVVSHKLSFLKENCDRILWIKDGSIYKDGGTTLLDDYVAEYRRKHKKKRS